jgi:hypothetical protein
MSEILVMIFRDGLVASDQEDLLSNLTWQDSKVNPPHGLSTAWTNLSILRVKGDAKLPASRDLVPGALNQRLPCFSSIVPIVPRTSSVAPWVLHPLLAILNRLQCWSCWSTMQPTTWFRFSFFVRPSWTNNFFYLKKIKIIDYHISKCDSMSNQAIESWEDEQDARKSVTGTIKRPRSPSDDSEDGGDDYKRRVRLDYRALPWNEPDTMTRTLASSELFPSLRKTQTLLENFSRDVKRARASLLNCSRAVPQSEWLNLLGRNAIDLDHVFSNWTSTTAVSYARMDLPVDFWKRFVASSWVFLLYTYFTFPY